MTACYFHWNNPFVTRLFRTGYVQGFGDEDAEAFAGIVAEPAAFEAVLEAKFQAILRALGDDRDIGAEGVEVVALAGEGHFAVPDDNAHEGNVRGSEEEDDECVNAEGGAQGQVVDREEGGE